MEVIQRLLLDEAINKIKAINEWLAFPVFAYSSDMIAV